MCQPLPPACPAIDSGATVGSLAVLSLRSPSLRGPDPVISIVRALVIEKETRIKEAMRMMGLPSWINWLAWFVKCFTFMAISMLIITVVLFQGEILLASNWFLVLIFLLLFSTSTITYCFFVSAIFSSANMAAIAVRTNFPELRYMILDF